MTYLLFFAPGKSLTCQTLLLCPWWICECVVLIFEKEWDRCRGLSTLKFIHYGRGALATASPRRPIGFSISSFPWPFWQSPKFSHVKVKWENPFCQKTHQQTEINVSSCLLGAFMFYCALSTVGLLLFWWLLPETKGRTLEEMEVVFSRPRTCPKPWDNWKIKKCKTGDSGACPEVGGESSKNVQYVQIRGLNRDRKELEEEDD